MNPFSLFLNVFDFLQPKFLPAIIGAVGAIAGAGIAANASKSASKRAGEAYDPAQAERPFYQSQLKSYIKNPDKFASNPTYKFLTNQGMQAVTRGMGPGYGGAGGNVMGELQRFGQQNAFNFAMPYYNLLANLGGFNYGNPGGAAGANQYAAQLPGYINEAMGGIGTLARGLYDRYGQGQGQSQQSYLPSMPWQQTTPLFADAGGGQLATLF